MNGRVDLPIRIVALGQKLVDRHRQRTLDILFGNSLTAGFVVHNLQRTISYMLIDPINPSGQDEKAHIPFQHLFNEEWLCHLGSCFRGRMIRFQYPHRFDFMRRLVLHTLITLGLPDGLHLRDQFRGRDSCTPAVFVKCLQSLVKCAAECEACPGAVVESTDFFHIFQPVHHGTG